MTGRAQHEQKLAAGLEALRGLPVADLDTLIDFRPRRKKAGVSRVVGFNITPMIDMTFLLLTFYILASSFEQSEGVLSARLPRTGAVATTPLPISPIHVRVHPAGSDPSQYAVSIDSITQRPSSPTELTALLLEVQQRPGFDADTPVVVHADPRIRWDHVVNVWNAAVRAKYRSIAFGDQ